LVSTEARVEVAAEVRISREELARRAEREIEEAFREYVPPLIEHRPVDEKATWPDRPPEPSQPMQPVQSGRPRDYALAGPLEAAPEVVKRLDRYRRAPRPVGGGWSG
jgi:hypothetical protein